MKLKTRALALVAMGAAVTTFACSTFLPCDTCTANPTLPPRTTAPQPVPGAQGSGRAPWAPDPGTSRNGGAGAATT